MQRTHSGPTVDSLNLVHLSSTGLQVVSLGWDKMKLPPWTKIQPSWMSSCSTFWKLFNC